jgi:hypothetical protein
MAIFKGNIPQNATNVSITTVMVDVDDNNFDIIDSDICFNNERIGNHEVFMRILYTIVDDEESEITTMRLSNEF